jgi:hypothetical protein
MMVFQVENAPDGKFLSGDGTPASTLGRNGDSYVDLTTGQLHTNVDGTWTIVSPIDGWSRQVATATESFGLATDTDIAAIAGFAPTANAVYEFEARLIVATTAAATGARPSIFVPTGITDLAYDLRGGVAGLTSDVVQWGGPATFLNTLSHANANVGYMARLDGVISVGASPGAGNVRPRMRSENGGTNVEVRRGSIFKYRRIL